MSRCRPRSAHGSWSAAASLTRPELEEAAFLSRNPPHGRMAPDGRRDLVDPELRARLHLRVRADHLRVHHHVLGPAALLALAEQDPALPVRRLRAVPQDLPPALAVLRGVRLLADRRRPGPVPPGSGHYLDPRSTALGGR